MVRQFALNARSRFDRTTLRIEALENRDVPSVGMEDVLSLPHLAGMSDTYPIGPIHVALPPSETISSQGTIGKPLLKQQRDRFAVGSGAGQSTTVNVYDSQTNALLGILTPYGRDFTGGARVVTADVTGDGVQDVIVAPGAGSQAWVKVYDGTNLHEVRSFLAYTSDFTGGIFVAVGDVDHDGRNDIVTGAGENGGPHVKMFSGADLFPIADVTVAVLPYARRSFFAYESDFRGGVSVAVADVNGDGYADIITGAGHGGGPRVTVVSGKDQSILENYFAYDPSMRSGIMVAAGDINGNGRAEIVTALTMTYLEEAQGIAAAAADAGLPAVVSFTVETDGRLPTGMTLSEAVRRTDDAVGGVAYHMINCAHPSHFATVLDDAKLAARIGGIRANASRMSHAELDEAAELDEGNPHELANDYRALLDALPNLCVLGGCCGTDHRHVDAIARECLPLMPR